MKFIDGVILIEEIYRFPTIFLIILWVIIASGLWICLDLARNMSKTFWIIMQSFRII